MDGSTLLETTSSPRTGAFDRPDPLKIPAAASSEFGKHPWHSGSSIWHAAPHGSLSSRASEDLTSRSESIRQKSASSVHFPRLADGASLPPTDDNSRPTAKPASSPWPFSTVPSADSRPRAHLNSPPKQDGSASWHFPRDISSESSFLLHNSDPDVEPAAGSRVRNGVPLEFHIALQNSGLGIPGSARKMHGSSVEDKNTLSGSVSAVHSNSNSIDGIDNGVTSMPRSGKKAPLVDNGAASAQRFASTAAASTAAAAAAAVAGLASPTHTKSTTKAQRRETLQMSTQQSLPFVVEDGTADSFKNLVISTHHSRVHAVRGTSSSLFPSSEAAAGCHMNHINHHVAANSQLPPQLRLNADPVNFQPAAALNSFFDVAADSNAALFSLYPTTWPASNPPGTPQSTEARNGGSLQYYSSGATPSTGRESGPSANGSGLSSRSSSMRDFTIVDRKLGNLDSFPQSPHSSLYSAAGVPSISHSPYEFAANANMRMNPLAGTYTPFGVSAYGGVSAVPSYAMNARMGSHEQEAAAALGRSRVLEDFRVHHKTSKRYELREIFGHVVEFSGDQHGSRFIQQKLETANSDEKEQIFKEIQTNCLQLMTDVFGNYVIQKLFEHGNQAQKKSLANYMKGHVLALSTQMYGCRVVQKALEHVLTDQQASLVKELDGPNKQLLRVIRDQNGNHVVQKAIERVPAEHIQFIIEAHRGEAIKLATHTYGCRVIQRILENCDAAAKQVVLDELYTCIPPLITDAFGNYVVQHIIEKGDPEGRRRVVSIVVQQALTFSKHKFASNVVEKCIDNADADQRSDIFRRLVGPNEQGQTPVLGLLRDQYGNYVIQKVHSWLKGAEREALVNEIKLCLPQLKRTSYGKQVMAIEKLLYGTPGPAPSGTMPASEDASPANEAAAGRHAAGAGRTPQPPQDGGAQRMQPAALFRL